MSKINQLKATITNLNLEKGSMLANKLKTKWYNEGERSNKYFLALLRRKEINGQLNTLVINITETRNEDEIEAYVTTFYKNLYNQDPEHCTEAEKQNLISTMEPLNDNEIASINQQLTFESLFNTLKDTNDSCPGPDGIPYSNLRATWQWYGPVLLKAWQHSLQTKKLPESHKISWLRLIPKIGKNSKDLKNWRPITLSNCDHKLITKALSRQLTDNLNRIISGNQTAYLKGRSISDNLRLVTLANKLTKREPNLNGLIIALDAKKAFDSVNHSYIKEILAKIGLQEFIQIFELLYKESQVDIMINDKLCKGYSIGNGVKQGDALSCALFILAMEPLIRKIEANQEIGQLTSSGGISFQKCIGYANDINVITANSIHCVRATIKEFEKFTKVSGLHLNADKTEIFKLSATRDTQNFSFHYRGQLTLVTNSKQIKLNGIELATDPAYTHKLNFEAVKQKMDNKMAGWSNRGVSIQGKILIYKTFGLSQLIYISRVLKFTKKENSELKNLIYKFIWNTNYHSAKAPDRIRRQYLNTAIKKGGFGMIEHEEIIKAMNTKQILVNLNGTHPIKQILEHILTISPFNAKTTTDLDGPCENYCETMNRINGNLLTRDPLCLQQDRIAKDLLLKEPLKNIVRQDRRNCLELAILRYQGKTTVSQLLTDQVKANHFRMRLLDYKFATLMDACLNTPRQAPIPESYIPIGKRYKLAPRVTSKELRLALLNNEGIDNFKLPVDRDLLTDSMIPKISKLKCTRAKTLALRLVHKDIYTSVRLKKFGLKDSDECPRCKQTEDLEHLLKDCWYTKVLWKKIGKLYSDTDNRRQRYNPNNLDFVVGARLSKAKLKLHLEIIRRLCNKDRPILLPSALIKQAIDYLVICDREHFKYYKKLKNSITANT